MSTSNIRTRLGQVLGDEHAATLKIKRDWVFELLAEALQPKMTAEEFNEIIVAIWYNKKNAALILEIAAKRLTSIEMAAAWRKIMKAIQDYEQKTFR
ncbi:MAG: hypothetical protein Q7R54_00640 [bacterium]|nr:hypothetical protein [bacterium]